MQIIQYTNLHMYISFAYDHHKLLFVFSTPCSEQRLGSDRTSQETWWLWLGKVSAHGIAGGGGSGEPLTFRHCCCLQLLFLLLPCLLLSASLSLPGSSSRGREANSWVPSSVAQRSCLHLACSQTLSLLHTNHRQHVTSLCPGPEQPFCTTAFTYPSACPGDHCPA